VQKDLSPCELSALSWRPGKTGESRQLTCEPANPLAIAFFAAAHQEVQASCEPGLPLRPFAHRRRLPESKATYLENQMADMPGNSTKKSSLPNWLLIMLTLVIALIAWWYLAYVR
jgi:hypothetical protein